MSVFDVEPPTVGGLLRERILARGMGRKRHLADYAGLMLGLAPARAANTSKRMAKS